ncbi:glutamine amidotransferase-related protein [Aestuariivirga sp.]|uniref:glutamine amidotransferase-related protein n=1 Tax=Aestuariivirga sp. TaxID=2650926 RepID=UPI00391A3412
MNPSRNRVIALLHDPQDMPNRCTDWLAAAGYEVVAACPAAGEPIPELDGATAGVVIFGGRYDVALKGELPFLRAELVFIEDVLRRDLPYLGLCLGAQLLADVLGEMVGPHPRGHAEYGYYDLIPTAEGRAFIGASSLKVLQSHWHGWYRTPAGATLLAFSAAFPQQAFRYCSSAYGLQFHPEATRATLSRWISRRPAERHFLQGAHPPERQLADHLAYDAALGTWFSEFLSRWIGPAPT